LLATAALALIVLTVGGVPSPAVAQDSNIQQLLLELERLRNDMSDLQRFVYKGGEVPPPSLQPTTATPTIGSGVARTAQLEIRFSQVEDEMRTLTGRVEEVAHGIDLLGQRIDKLVADVDFRLTAIERGQPTGMTPAAAYTEPAATTVPATTQPALVPQVSSEPGVLGTIPASALPAETASGTAVAVQPAGVAVLAPALPPGTPKQQYDYAYDVLKQAVQQRGEFDEARRAFDAFIENHPDDDLTDNAYYWLGETYYVTKDYASAAHHFALGLQRFPDGNKAPDIMLKLGMSLFGSGRTEQACIAFEKFGELYAGASARLKEKVAREALRSGCG
jgi:tol-pal system protein YbgF